MSNFVTKTIAGQRGARQDIIALAEEVAENSKLLQQLVGFQREQNTREALLVQISEDITNIAKSITETLQSSGFLIGDLHGENKAFRALLEDVLQRLRGYTALNGLTDRMEEKYRDSNEHGAE